MMPPPATAVASGLVTPRFDAEDVPVAPLDGGEPSLKKARICMIAGVEYEHEDDHNYTAFTHDELDGLEEYEFEMSADDVTEELSADLLLQRLVFPYTEHEPQLPPGQLAELDALAMEVETSRLKKMGVLLPPETVEGLNPKRLSTRYVITSRDKVIDGKRSWLRRARYVAQGVRMALSGTPGLVQSQRQATSPTDCCLQSFCTGRRSTHRSSLYSVQSTLGTRF